MQRFQSTLHNPPVRWLEPHLKDILRSVPVPFTLKPPAFLGRRSWGRSTEATFTVAPFVFRPFAPVGARELAPKLPDKPLKEGEANMLVGT